MDIFERFVKSFGKTWNHLEGYPPMERMLLALQDIGEIDFEVRWCTEAFFEGDNENVRFHTGKRLFLMMLNLVNSYYLQDSRIWTVKPDEGAKGEASGLTGSVGSTFIQIGDSHKSTLYKAGDEG